jgi:hypothetical protein
MRVARTALLVAGIIVGLLAAITVISYGYHRMTNPSFSPPRSSTTTRATAMTVARTSFRIIERSAG